MTRTDKSPTTPPHKKERQPGELFTNSLGLNLAWVPPGTAWLGGGGGRAGIKQVTIPQGFYLGIYPVTQAQWQAVLGNNPSWFSRSGGGKDQVKKISDADLIHFPVEQVSWEDVQQFLNQLNEREGKRGWLYRLPTEVEWEYACRGGPVSRDLSAFHFYFDKPTNDLSSELANFQGNHPAGQARKGKYLERTSQVGLYPGNALGLYDMHGNVWDWCHDDESPGQVFRGGGWYNFGALCRAANRRRGRPKCRFRDLGFRLARVPSGKHA